MPAAIPVFDPNPTLGALEVGVLLSTFLFGIVTIQTYVYYSNFPKDGIRTKALVAFVWLCELGQTICVCHTLYLATITFYGHPEKMIKAPASLSVAILFSGFIGPLVQTYFAGRIWKLSRSPYIPIACCILAFLRFVGSVVAFAEALAMDSLAQYESQWGWLLTTILAIGASLDLVIAATLVFYLTQQRSGAYKSTVNIIDKLIAWTIETGLLTSMAGIVMLICFVKMKDNYIWLAFFMFLARLFSNSLLAALNARTTLRNMKEDIVEFSNHSAFTAASRTAISKNSSSNKPINIEVNKMTSSDRSMGDSYKLDTMSADKAAYAV